MNLKNGLKMQHLDIETNIDSIVISLTPEQLYCIMYGLSVAMEHLKNPVTTDDHISLWNLTQIHDDLCSIDVNTNFHFPKDAKV